MEPEPWDFRTEDTRKEDTLPVFIIFCEDEVSEPIYFKFFETSQIKVNPIKGQKSKIDNVIKAILHSESENLMQSEGNGIGRIVDGDTQVWCVFDRDMGVGANQQIENTSFNVAIETAERAGIKVAWSNDCFELWILLHFTEIDHTDVSSKNRVTYYQKLTDIFKNISNPNNDLVKCLAYHGFNYKDSLKSERNFRDIVRLEMIKNTFAAISRSKVIESHWRNSNLKPHEKSPCTMVHNLVEELIRVGGKSL